MLLHALSSPFLLFFLLFFHPFHFLFIISTFPAIYIFTLMHWLPLSSIPFYSINIFCQYFSTLSLPRLLLLFFLLLFLLSFHFLVVNISFSLFIFYSYLWLPLPCHPFIIYIFYLYFVRSRFPHVSKQYRINIFYFFFSLSFLFSICFSNSHVVYHLHFFFLCSRCPFFSYATYLSFL